MKKSTASISLVLAAALAIPPSVAFAATEDPNPSAMELAHAELSEKAATEGIVLLANENEALPMSSDGNVALFGVGAYATIKGGTGSGDVNNRYTVSVRQGFDDAGYDVTTSDGYWNTMTNAYDTMPPPPRRTDKDYSAADQLLTAESVQPKAATDTAIYVIARTSGEFNDRNTNKGNFHLADVERANIELVGQNYDNVIVALNVGGVVDTAFVAEINAASEDPKGSDAIDSLVLMSQPGQEAGHAVVKVLNGTVNPSAKLTSTWAAAYEYYPTSETFSANDGNVDTEVYSEGIYIGYRYFDSFYEQIEPADPDAVVNFPFGHGLSYTDFDVEPVGVHMEGADVVVTATVTNSGDTHSGREVVQVYVSAPAGGALDVPYQELGGSVKTDDLAPGATQAVTVRFALADLASFDADRASYVLKEGDYIVRVGNSSRETQVAGVLELGEEKITEVVAHQQNASSPEEELAADPADFYSYPSEKQEIADAARASVDAGAIVTVDSISALEQDVPVDESSPYNGIDDGNVISSVPVYLDADQADWERTGAPYELRTGEEVEYVETDADATLYDVARGDISMERFVAGLDATALANIVEGAATPGSTLVATGSAGYTTAVYENLGIPAMALADGPAGLRLTKQFGTDPVLYQFGTAWPIGTMLAQSWDPELIATVGEAIGQEMNEYGVHLWLAPGMNIHRDPFNGRNFEYYSEDPLVSGLSAAAMITGVQSNEGVGVTVKHYTANSQQNNQNFQDSVMTERTLREIYLKGFEIAIKQAQPAAVMTSWNKINGRWTSASYDLVTDVLRGEWDFQGMVMTDWNQANRSGVFVHQYSGNDIIMPGRQPNQILEILRPTTAEIDATGLPVVDIRTQEVANGEPTVSYVWNLGELVLAEDGAESISTTVDSASLATAPTSTETAVNLFQNETVTPIGPFGTVQEAYDWVTGILAAEGALSSEQAAAIDVADVQYETDESSPVTSFTVNVAGDYPDDSTYILRLGDVQRSAMNILNIVSQSSAFEELAGIQGVSGISVGAYSDQFTDLEQFVSVGRGDVIDYGSPQSMLSALEAIRDADDAKSAAGYVAISHLQNAIKQLDKGKDAQAVAHLERFIAQLAHPKSAIDDAVAAVFAAQARVLIDSLS